MFPPRHPNSSTAHPATANYSLFFRESDSDSMQTTAVFRSKDTSMIDIFRACRGIDLRIEYGTRSFLLVTSNGSETKQNEMDQET
jgi:hypothetical protein